ncbi:serine/threonine protein kinase [Mycolicibacterium sp. P1-18]|uniref:protein kinase domain-containing protein n=1 Tax=Mycolicibacterium sp. P1-18 TaxID=2024615 RepID=UPI0011F254CD|nr:serine/threonine-protein kinase [Mycolicibacterium sp. P1-18]KAA0102239.1 serine/threonine protein kinase [Mycolicibacterium sp. P1-18]
MPLRSGDVFAGYTVVRQLGEGASGAVYLTAHPRTLRQDALRVLPAAASADPDFRARFHRRAEMAATLWHPHVVGVHAHGEFQGLLWASMDYVDGSDAATLVRDRYDTGMPADQVLDIVTAIADALDHAHARRLTHGDVTAASVLLTNERRRRASLTDFGVPRGAEDARADQYGLAATARHLLSGVAPTPDVGPLGATRQDLAAYDPALLRALAPDPRDRFDACLDFAAALRDAATAATQAQPIADPAAFAPTEHLANPKTGSGLPEVFVAAWSAEEPDPLAEFEPEVDPEFAPTMAAGQLPPPYPVAPYPAEQYLDDPYERDSYPPEPEFDPPASRHGRIWAVTGVAALLALVVVLVVVVVRGGGDGREAAGTATSSSAAAPSSPVDAAPTTGVGGRPRPAEIRGADPTGEDCEGGFQITGQAGWASQGVRGSPAATCAFVGNVLKAYWNDADPSRDSRSVVAAGAIPCGEGAACVGDDFLVTCSAEGSDPWITCRGGRDAVVVLY